jgi:putative oxidoreductase
MHKATALAIVRMTIGSVFILHGMQKVFGSFGGPGLEGFAQSLAGMGIASIWSYLAAFCELIGGIMLFFGIAAEIGAFLVIPVMAVGVYLIHWSKGYFAQNGGYEYALNLIFLAIAIIIGGAGRWTLWNPGKKYRKELMDDLKQRTK